MPAPAEPPSRWRDLRVRVLSAAVLLPVALAALWFGGAAWQALIILAGVALFWEWTGLSGRLALWLRLAGYAYIAAAAIALVHLRDATAYGFGNTLFVLLAVWGTDIGAYLTGRLIGGPKLAPGISPGKTWSGAAGGLATALLMALAHGGSPRGVLVAGALSIVSQIGDLAESAAKRNAGVKDSSHLIPGHGGVFDRVDGLLPAALLAAVLALLLGPAHPLWQ